MTPRLEQVIFRISKKFRTALGPNQCSPRWRLVFFPGVKSAAAWTWPLAFIQCRG